MVDILGFHNRECHLWCRRQRVTEYVYYYNYFGSNEGAWALAWIWCACCWCWLCWWLLRRRIIHGWSKPWSWHIPLVGWNWLLVGWPAGDTAAPDSPMPFPPPLDGANVAVVVVEDELEAEVRRKLSKLSRETYALVWQVFVVKISNQNCFMFQFLLLL